MKKFIKNNIIGFILGAVIFSGITVSAYTILANNIGYTPSDSSWKKTNGEDITNVKDAIDELYSKTGVLMTNTKILHNTNANNDILPPNGNITIDEGLSSYKYIMFSVVQCLDQEYYVRVEPTIIAIDDLINQGTLTYTWNEFTNTISYINDKTLGVTQSTGFSDPIIILFGQ